MPQGINVHDLEPVPMQCPSCGAYVHRYLDGCPWCGWSRPSLYSPVVPRRSKRPADLPTTQAELSNWLDAHRVPAQIKRSRLADGANITPGEIGASEAFAGLALGSLTDENGDFDWGALNAGPARYFALMMGARSDAAFKLLTHRYFGGLPLAPDPTDVNLRMSGRNLILRSTNGRVLAEIPPERVITAHASLHRTGGSSWTGISFGHVIYFPDHSFLGGALTVVFAGENGATLQFSVGNRDGLFAKKGPAEQYQDLVQLIGGLANMAALARQSEIGFPNYARELGFSVEDASSTAQPRAKAAAGDDLAASLRSLDGLHRDGLITDREYQKKRAEILARI